jgi:(R,R)-butanediol dehydrogenase/meso-butanediol dehydrogenase/diacetyl reductase
MKALTFHGRRDLRLEDVQEPVAGPGQVRVRVTDCLLSQSIVDFNVEGHLVDLSQPHPRTGVGLGYVMGQQFGGVIESVGEGVDPRRVSEIVGVAPGWGCGACSYCDAGRPNHCGTLAYHGLLGAHGGLARYCVVAERQAIVLPRRELGPFFECLLVVHNLLRKARPFIARARSILVLGAGPIGLSAGALLRDVYGRPAVLHDVLPGRRARAARLGYALASEADLAGAHDLVLDCAGTNPDTGGSALLDGLGRVEKGGALMFVGTYLHQTSIAPMDVLLRELTLAGSFAYTEQDLTELVPRLGDVRLDLSPISERLSLETAATEGLLRGEVDRDGFTALIVEP